MISQSELKRIRALHLKKVRDDEGRFLVQGRKVVAELLASGLRTEVVFATDEAAEWVRGRFGRNLPVEVGAPHQLERIGTLERGNELVAVAFSPPAVTFRAPGAGELMLALDDIHDPRNMGGLLRIADWFGIRRLLCSPDCIEVHNPKVVQSSMGSVFRVEVRHASLVDELRACAASGAHVYLATMDGPDVYDVELARPAVLVMGSESHGLSDAMRALHAGIVSIPRFGGAESLNVAMAAAALCTEFARRAR